MCLFVHVRVCVSVCLSVCVRVCVRMEKHVVKGDVGEGGSSGIVQLLLFNYSPFSSQLKEHDIIIT